MPSHSVRHSHYRAPRGTDACIPCSPHPLGRAVTGSTEVRGTDLKYKRTYVDGPMYAPVTGHASQAQGMTLLERTYDGILTGKDDRLAFQRFADVVSGEGRRPGSVVTTIDPEAQQEAYDGLTDLKGARGPWSRWIPGRARCWPWSRCPPAIPLAGVAVLLRHCS